VFDRERKLRYAGRWDDSRYADLSTVKSRDAEVAINALLDGKPVPVETTKPFGCSTKWLEKVGDNLKVQEKWNNTPVTMETIDAAAVAKLAKNETNKLRLINVWATWCAPCVAEFPGLVSLSRRFQGRDFELITISIDDPAHEAKAKAFLEKQHAASPPRVVKSLAAEGRTTNNYHYTGADVEALQKALDADWQGPVPHTIVVAPGGKVIYRKTGLIDVEELQTKLLDTLGPYYTPAAAAR
jgi:thiol-disulfide isomerase/thioredoxin